MKATENKAWKILTPDEQGAVVFGLGHDKSTWEAGEILGKAHYKYLEIKARAERFFKLFAEHFTLYPNLIPESIPISPEFKQYLVLLIEFRKTMSETIKQMDNPGWKLLSTRERFIEEQMRIWEESDLGSAHRFRELVLEFDRWNNFRILPKNLQEPHAFKRRNKNRHKKHIKTMLTIPEFILERIKEKYETDKEKCGYVALVTNMDKKAYEIITVKRTDEAHDRLGKLGLYIFNSKDLAVEFIDIVLDYFTETHHHCRDGLKFWPTYRVLINNALNCNQVQQISFSRKYMEDAFKDIDKKTASKVRENYNQNKKG